MNTTHFITACSISLMALAMPSMSFAQAMTLKLPQETAKLKPSKLPGYQVAIQKCAICHSADYINQQPPGMNQTQWTAEVRKMEHAYAAPLSDVEVNQIGEYLAVTYGTAKAVVQATPAVVAAGPVTASGAVDVQALLTANACLGCHAINTKVVGPSYHDVALKYKGDAQAQAKLEASIRAGGAGKWGEVPMPMFAALKPQELKALAAFVLKQ